MAGKANAGRIHSACVGCAGKTVTSLQSINQQNYSGLSGNRHCKDHRQLCVLYLSALEVLHIVISMLNKEELKQSFCGRMPFLSPTSRNHSLDLVCSLTTLLLLSCAKSHMLSASRLQPHLLHVSAVDRRQTWSMDKS